MDKYLKRPSTLVETSSELSKEDDDVSSKGSDDDDSMPKAECMISHGNFDKQTTTRKRKKYAARKYDKDYLSFGFVAEYCGELPCPQCVLCLTVLSNEAMKPAKLSRHLQTKHPEVANKPLEFFVRKANEIQKQKLFMSSAVKVNENALRASYLVAQRVAKNRKPHTIAETLIMPAAIDIVREMLGEKAAEKLKVVPVSNNTIQRRINNLADDVSSQLIERLQRSRYYALQMNESTDVRYIHRNAFEEDFLMCKPLPLNTTSSEIFRTEMNS